MKDFTDKFLNLLLYMVELINIIIIKLLLLSSFGSFNASKLQLKRLKTIVYTL